MPKTYFKATVEILLEVDEWAEGCDAINEALRPLLKSFAEVGEEDKTAFVDWRYAPNGEPEPDTGAGFEYADPAIVQALEAEKAAADAAFTALLSEPMGDEDA